MVLLDLGINYGASYSLNFATDIISNRAGVEQRRALYQQPLLKVAIGNRMVNKSELDYLLAFFEAAQGRLNEFEIRDWTDYQVTDGTLGPVIEGRQSVIKTYTLGGETIERLLTAVVEETIIDDGGSISCEFNVPVRFDQDAFPLSFEAYSPDGERLFDLQELTCTEVRKVWPEAPLQVPPASIDADLGIGKDYGTTGGQAYSTSIMALPSGWDDRQSNYSGSIGQWNIGSKIVKVAEMTRLITMFRLCRGQLVPFNFYDWQTETWQTVRFNTDSLGLQFEAHDENYYGENIGDRESLFAINGLPVRATAGGFVCTTGTPYSANLSLPLVAVEAPRQTETISFSVAEINGDILPITNFVLDDFAFIVPVDHDIMTGYSLTGTNRAITIPNDALIIYEGGNPNFADGALTLNLTTTFTYGSQTYTINRNNDNPTDTIPLSQGIIGVIAMGVTAQPHNAISLSFLSDNGYISDGVISFKIMHVAFGAGNVELGINVPAC